MMSIVRQARKMKNIRQWIKMEWNHEIRMKMK